MKKIGNNLFQSKLKTILSEPAVIDGGIALRDKAFPCREVSNLKSLEKIKEVFEYYWDRQQDIPYQAYFEETYCKEFSDYHGGGYADAVCSGSVAVFLALKALDLPEGAKVAISPVTDPGAVSAVLFARLVPIVVDSATNDFNISVKILNESLIKHKDIKAVLVTHVGGIPLDMKALMRVATLNNVEVIEDCSQAHGAEIDGQKVGTFGRLAAYSTMFTKNHSTGSTGGVVLCSSEQDYWKVRALADRQKPFSSPEFNARNPGSFMGPGLNFNSNEIACALGSLSLSDLDKTIKVRQNKVDLLNKLLSSSSLFSLQQHASNIKPSYFFCTLNISDRLSATDIKSLKETLLKKGVSLNVNYQYIVSEWEWMRSLFPKLQATPNASNFRRLSINVLFHEKYSDSDIQDLALVLLRAEYRLLNRISK